jgi:hypothetical protein
VLRLLAGILKGLFVGFLIGALLVVLGLGTPGALVASIAAAAAAVLVAPISGKKIWEKDGVLQSALKAVAGLFLGPGLMWLARRYAVVPLPDVTKLPGIGSLPGLEALRGTELTVGGFALTSVALVAAVLAGFYDLDNTDGPTSKPASKAGSGKRVDPELAALTGLDPAELDAATEETDRRRSKG